MTDSGSGVYTLPPGYLAVTGQTIQASQHNPPLEDLAASMNRRYMSDGRAPMLGNVPMNGYKATGAANGSDPQDYVTLAQMTAAIAAVASVPTGLMVPYSGMTTPMGWLVLNGQEVLRATYASLWAHAQASGNIAANQGSKGNGQFGPGNGSTTFTLPNLYADDGYFIRPMASGRTIGSVQADELKSHAHGVTDPGHAHTNPLGNLVSSSGIQGGSVFALNPGTTGAAVTGISVNATGGTETRPKNIAYPVLIKT